jgi:hypothetical protein
MLFCHSASVGPASAAVQRITPGRGPVKKERDLMKQARPFLAAVALMLAALPTGVQASAKYSPRFPVRIRATIEKFDKNMLTAKTEKGGELTLEVTPKTNISGVDARQLTDIKANDFVGVTAIRGTDGKLHATEVHIFPEAMRGFGAGRRGSPEKSVTNATVVGMADSSDGKMLTLSVKGETGATTDSTDIDVSGIIPVVAVVPGDPNLLKPGVDTVMFILKESDGDLIALGIVTEKDGIKPPM